MIKHQLLAFDVTGVDEIMIVKFDYKLRIVIGTVCVFEVYSSEEYPDDSVAAPKVNIVTAEEIEAED